MTSKGLGEMFGGDSADMCNEKFPLMLIGDERMVKRAQKVSEDPHRSERKLDNVGWIYWRKLNVDSHSFSFDRFFY